MVDTLVILAPGLLGGSVAMAARARGVAGRIVIWARRPETRLALAEQPWCDVVAESPEEAVREASLVVLAAPVTRIVELAGQIAPALPAGAIVTDVGSVKGELCRLASAAMPAGVRFIGAHPMAGGEKTGWENGRAELFEGRTVFVTPLAPELANDPAVERVARFWHALGGEIVTLSPDEHDEIVAHISHLPQALATTLGVFLSGKPPGWRNLAGNGLKDTSRIAASDPTMWTEIFQQNRDELLRAIGGLQDELQAMQAALANRDWIELRSRFERAKAWREGFRPRT
ncbi:MAG TPA: prephenate dehydrogenase/arogenate dehydrogenase family protein [Candidatus Synoicihabitans sp.]|nr:prephenate dehydrogenase/arogenate dehydrogenase family protein [Candidatus Synoicihabitans sp.]